MLVMVNHRLQHLPNGLKVGTVKALFRIGLCTNKNRDKDVPLFLPLGLSHCPSGCLDDVNNAFFGINKCYGVYKGDVNAFV